MILEWLRSSTTWFTIALVVAIFEVLVPGFLFLGFAAGAAILGAVLWIFGPDAFPGAAGIAYLASAWGLASMLSWAALRRCFGPKDSTGTRKVTSDINEAPYKGDRD